MAKLEQDMPFLRTHKAKNSAKFDQDLEAAEKTEEPAEKFAPSNTDANQTTPFLSAANANNAAAKRAKCGTSTSNLVTKATDQDWEYLLNDEFLSKMYDNEKNSNEFGRIFVKPQPKSVPVGEITEPKATINNPKVAESVTSSPSVNENIKTAGSHFIPRQKRPINTTASSASGSSLAAAVAAGAQTIPSGGGILFPHLKSILFTLHLVYEECKLYRSLSDKFCENLIQILYLLANELNLPLYMNYYELEYPSLLLELKAQRVFKSRNGNLSTGASFQSGTLPVKNSLSHFISQEPPVLYKFLLNLTNTKDLSTTIINPFPVIGKF